VCVCVCVFLHDFKDTLVKLKRGKERRTEENNARKNLNDAYDFLARCEMNFTFNPPF